MKRISENAGMHGRMRDVVVECYRWRQEILNSEIFVAAMTGMFSPYFDVISLPLFLIDTNPAKYRN